jgi:hypothetical protein
MVENSRETNPIAIAITDAIPILMAFPIQTNSLLTRLGLPL